MNLYDILKHSQPSLKKALADHLKERDIINSDGFLYSSGDIPVLLVAHLDTVHRRVKRIIKHGDILTSPSGIGGDDRCGVYMILEIIKKVNCHVLFCEDEESGAVGARKFIQSGIIPDINYIVELDRRGSNDAVFYDCDNPDFTKFVLAHKFKFAYGSFSDISVIAPALGVAAVNISSGFYNEHSKSEYINLRDVHRNIKRVTKMILADTQKFDYISAFDYYDDVLPLMQLSDGDYISLNGELDCNYHDYCISDSGRVYWYDYLDDCAYPVENCQAFNRFGMPLKYNDDNAVMVEVINSPLDDFEYYGEVVLA